MHRKFYSWAWDLHEETMYVTEQTYDDDGLMIAARVFLNPNDVPDALRFLWVKQVWIERDDGQMVRLHTMQP